MPRKQVGAIDSDLLAKVDERAGFLGQTRRTFIERTLQARLANPDSGMPPEIAAMNHLADQGDFAAVDRLGSALGHQSVPGPNVENVRSSGQAKRDTEPRPKKGKR